ncbi:hypothetical protein JDV02_000769 [Purpureocillium takamizusanense]|uniref:Uncharacterized protein n=1 Tax=Purpureocillium takamizusanense TaxID=2060973 RepID=A0A9Q8Q7Z0_9HYPO|nr:uncharacterized protein JDV02_000769 [Purpureocillium takamizusanense]UNI14098.1 hypothetical protein JDV02_000769 [Purpureocillium takamizusanense]
MAPEHDVFRRVGRGGAGNYVPAADADRSSKDLEAQQQQQQVDTTAAAAAVGTSGHGAAAPAARRAGRGGAGNYVEAERLPSAREKEEDLAGEVKAAVASSLERKGGAGAASSRGMGGRGGAGNWNTESGQEDREREEEEGEGGKVQELERKVKEAVDKGLRMPDKVHHGRDKGSGSS